MSTAQPIPKPPTAAQMRWLRAIDTGEIRRFGHSWVAALYNRHMRAGTPTRCTYVMTCDLHDGGWIDAVSTDGSLDYKIVLTPDGRAVIADKAPA
jgi:hypothetical protein